MKSIVAPEVLHAAVPRIASNAEARVEKKNMMNTLQALGATTGATGFDPARQFQYVANIDSSVWGMILAIFAKYDEQTGDLLDDGLLYTKDCNGDIKMNRDFFYTILSELEAAGYNADMRGKIKLT